MPVFMFRMFTGDDLKVIWKYLRTANLNLDTDTSYAILPEAQTVRTWLTRQKQQASNSEWPVA